MIFDRKYFIDLCMLTYSIQPDKMAIFDPVKTTLLEIVKSN